MSYYDSDEIQLKAFWGNNSTYQLKALIEVNMVVKNYIGSYQSEEGTPEKAAYDALCEKHGDMNFDRIILVHPWEDIRYPGVDFLSMEVTSNADYDAEHSAGASLADIMRINFSSGKPYIDSGYTEYDGGSCRICRSSDIVKSLAEVSQDDLILLGDGSTSYDPGIKSHSAYIATLIFDKNPTASKIHKFTVTMTADDGRTFTASVDMQFE